MATQPGDNTAVFPEVVDVLGTFMKEWETGIKTPEADKGRGRKRFKAAKRYYDENVRKRGGK